jgi:glycerol-1-phosphate dehydrogenase [NAD(P)+]
VSPILARMIATPVAIEVGSGTIARLAPLLADQRISPGGHVAVAVGPGQGDALAETLRPQLGNAEFFRVEGGTVQAALDLAAALRGGFYDALVGIGGGKTLDVAKYAATLVGLPMVAVATSIAHDGVASPVSSLEEGGRKGSFGVQTPVAVVIDLDYVRASDPRLRRAGIGDVVSNLSAVTDWRLAGAVRDEPVDGLATAFAVGAADSVLHRDDGIDDGPFLEALAGALVLSGLAMATAGNSRPCSGGEHEIVHAVDHLFPGDRLHGELCATGTLYTSFLRGDEGLTAAVDRCLTRHALPRVPADLGLSAEQFAAAVVQAPDTRPDRYTILEHLALDEAAVRRSVDEFAERFGG